MRPFVTRATRFVIVLEPNLLGTAAARTLIGDLQKFGVPLAPCLDRHQPAQRARRDHCPRTGKGAGGTVVGEVPVKADRNYPRAIELIAKRVSAKLPPRLRSPTAPRRASVPSGSAAPRTRGGSAAERSVGSEDVPPAERSARNRLKAEIHEQITKHIDVVAASRAHTDSRSSPNSARRSPKSPRSCSPSAPRSTPPKRAPNSNKRSSTKSSASGRWKTSCATRRSAKSWSTARRTIYVERGGELTLTNRRFIDERQLRKIIERIIAPLGRRIDESSPMVDARLPDGSRVNAIIEPLALNGSTLTIRRFGTRV